VPDNPTSAVNKRAPRIEIEPLAAHHNHHNFTRGEAELDQYLRPFAPQHATINSSRTDVAAERSTIQGFYRLAMAAILEDQLPPAHAMRFPRSPLPVARLARLAVDREYCTGRDDEDARQHPLRRHPGRDAGIQAMDGKRSATTSLSSLDSTPPTDIKDIAAASFFWSTHFSGVPG
jgi:hypothetical protein